MSSWRRIVSRAALIALLGAVVVRPVAVLEAWVPAFSQRSTAAPGAGMRSVDLPCQVRTPLKAVPGLREGSGLALSRQAPKRLFAINDSAEPEVRVLDLSGAPRGTVTIGGATVTDWEDVTTGRCPQGDCLYVSDIGDNNLTRSSVTVFRVREPGDGDRRAVAERIEAVYPDGPHDAEATFAGPTGRLYLITKETRGARVYAFPESLRVGVTNTLEHVTTLGAPRRRQAVSRVTDAEATADGRRVAVRTNDNVFVLPTASLLAGRWADAVAFSVRSLGEPQGEGIALEPNGDMWLLGEGGRRNVGTFAELRCPFGP